LKSGPRDPKTGEHNVTILAIINPQSLLGDATKHELSRRKGLWSEVRLLATDPEQVGAVTDFAGNAALVQECDAENLQGVDLAILLHGDPALAPALPAGAALLVVDPIHDWPEGTLAVGGVESVLTEQRSDSLFISPAPAVILLAHLLQPLTALGLSSAVAQVLMPASNHDQAGLDELFSQTRSILAMAEDRATEVFGKQIAFNLLPVTSDQSTHLEHLRRILGEKPAVALQIVQAGVFHSLACNLFVSFQKDPGPEKVRERLAAQPRIDLVAEGELPGPTDAAAREEILVADLRPSPSHPASYQLWAVMDNLTCGGASNVVEIVENVLAPTS
jgi:aspartate-semialdehyde dehydrogenase